MTVDIQFVINMVGALLLFIASQKGSPRVQATIALVLANIAAVGLIGTLAAGQWLLAIWLFTSTIFWVYRLVGALGRIE